MMGRLRTIMESRDLALAGVITGPSAIEAFVALHKNTRSFDYVAHPLRGRLAALKRTIGEGCVRREIPEYARNYCASVMLDRRE